MEYRALGRTGKRLSLLSLGCMRLPDDDEEGARVVSRAIDLGINYFETSPGYCEGRSEIKVGMGVKGRRDQIYISTKSFVRAGTKGDDVKRAFEASLKRLQVDRVDFYHIWDYQRSGHEAVVGKGGALDVLEKLRDEGLIGHIGITTHENNDNVIHMLETGRAESVTVNYHMLSRTVEPVIEYAGRKGIGVVAMTPLAGGLLVTPSEILNELLPGQYVSKVSRALQFVMSNPYVSTAPSGMTSVAEVEENVRVWAEFKMLSTEELERTLAALDQYKALQDKFCTGCNYCMPCSYGVQIPTLFRIRNFYDIFKLREWGERTYREFDKSALPDVCTECGECETKCPHGIPIIKQLKEVAQMFECVRE